MKRRVYVVTVKDLATGVELHREIKSAFNSGIRGGEDAIRNIARMSGESFEGGKPERTEDSSRNGTRHVREWTGSKTGRVVHTVVEKVS